jgi:dihydrolipoamide dehydrogenase
VMRTSVQNIYAAGDVTSSPMLAHTAYREGAIAARAILGKVPPAYNRSLIPRIVFTDPQIGCAGMTE